MNSAFPNRRFSTLRKFSGSRYGRGTVSLPGTALLLTLFAAGNARGQTLAYYRFEEGVAGTQTAVQPVPIPDSSGNGNKLLAFDPLAAPTYRSDNPGSARNPAAPNSLSVDFSVPTDPGRTRDLYTGGDGINSHVFNQFTIEASVKFNALGGFQTFIGKDGGNIPNSDPNLSQLYFQSPDAGAVGGRNIFSIRTHQADGAFVIVDGSTLIQAGVWYNVAAVSNGTLLSLYLQSAPGGAYTLENSAPFIGALYTDPAPTQDNIFTLGRGYFAGNLADQFHGLIDEVRISDAALSPSQFLFAPVPEPGSISLLFGMATVGAGLLHRRRRSRPSA